MLYGERLTELLRDLSIDTLTICGPENLKPDDLVVAAPLLATAPRALVLTGAPMLNDAGLEALLKVSAPVLEHLNVSQPSERRFKGSCLADFAFSLTSLTYLNLAEAKGLDPNAFVTIISGVSSTLKALNIRQCVQVDSRAVRSLMACQKLRQLCLAGLCKLETDAVVDIMAGCGMLQSLDVMRCARLNGATILEGAAQHCQEIQELIVGALPDIGDQEVLSLVMSTAGSGLLNLNISDSEITKSSLLAIQRHCPNLKKLDVSFCHGITENALVDMITFMPTMKVLNCRGCRFVKENAMFFIAQLLSSRALGIEENGPRKARALPAPVEKLGHSSGVSSSGGSSGSSSTPVSPQSSSSAASTRSGGSQGVLSEFDESSQGRSVRSTDQVRLTPRGGMQPLRLEPLMVGASQASSDQLSSASPRSHLAGLSARSIGSATSTGRRHVPPGVKQQLRLEPLMAATCLDSLDPMSPASSASPFASSARSNGQEQQNQSGSPGSQDHCQRHDVNADPDLATDERDNSEKAENSKSIVAATASASASPAEESLLTAKTMPSGRQARELELSAVPMSPSSPSSPSSPLSPSQLSPMSLTSQSLSPTSAGRRGSRMSRTASSLADMAASAAARSRQEVTITAQTSVPLLRPVRKTPGRRGSELQESGANPSSPSSVPTSLGADHTEFGATWSASSSSSNQPQRGGGSSGPHRRTGGRLALQASASALRGAGGRGCS